MLIGGQSRCEQQIEAAVLLLAARLACVCFATATVASMPAVWKGNVLTGSVWWLAGNLLDICMLSPAVGAKDKLSLMEGLCLWPLCLGRSPW